MSTASLRSTTLAFVFFEILVQLRILEMTDVHQCRKVDFLFAALCFQNNLVPAVDYALLPAVGYALLGSFHHFSLSRRLSAMLRAHRRFDVLLAVLVPVLLLIFFSPPACLLWFFRILTTCPFAVPPSVCLSLSTGFLAVALSPILSRDTLR